MFVTSFEGSFTQGTIMYTTSIGVQILTDNTVDVVLLSDHMSF